MRERERGKRERDRERYKETLRGIERKREKDKEPIGQYGLSQFIFKHYFGFCYLITLFHSRYSGSLKLGFTII